MRSTYIPILVLLFFTIGAGLMYAVLFREWKRVTQLEVHFGVRTIGAALAELARVASVLIVTSCALSIVIEFIFSTHKGINITGGISSYVGTQAIWCIPSALFYSAAVISLVRLLSFVSFVRGILFITAITMLILFCLPLESVKSAAGHVAHILFGIVPLSGFGALDLITIHIGQ